MWQHLDQLSGVGVRQFVDMNIESADFSQCDLIHSKPFEEVAEPIREYLWDIFCTVGGDHNSSVTAFVLSSFVDNVLRLAPSVIYNSTCREVLDLYTHLFSAL